MSSVILFLLIALLWLPCIGGAIAQDKHRSFLGAYLLCLFLPVIGIMLVLLQASRWTPTPLTSPLQPANEVRERAVKSKQTLLPIARRRDLPACVIFAAIATLILIVASPYFDALARYVGR